MNNIPDAVIERYSVVLANHGIATGYRPYFIKWLRYYLDFCAMYAATSSETERLPLFLAKPDEKNQPEELCRQAAYAVSLYLEMRKEALLRDGNPEVPWTSD